MERSAPAPIGAPRQDQRRRRETDRMGTNPPILKREETVQHAPEPAGDRRRPSDVPQTTASARCRKCRQGSARDVFPASHIVSHTSGSDGDLPRDSVASRRWGSVPMHGGDRIARQCGHPPRGCANPLDWPVTIPDAPRESVLNGRKAHAMGQGAIPTSFLPRWS